MQSLPSDALQLLNANQLSYDIMFSYCRTQLSLGLSVVLDCPFARVALFDEADRLAKQVSSWALGGLQLQQTCYCHRG